MLKKSNDIFSTVIKNCPLMKKIKINKSDCFCIFIIFFNLIKWIFTLPRTNCLHLFVIRLQIMNKYVQMPISMIIDN